MRGPRGGRLAGGPRCSVVQPATEQGSGALLVLACGATLTLALVFASLLAGVVRDAHRARSAADLAALAAVAGGPGLGDAASSSCANAARIASLNDARMSSCSVLADGSVLVAVEVDVSASGLLAHIGVLPDVVSSRARAGLAVRTQVRSSGSGDREARSPRWWAERGPP